MTCFCDLCVPVQMNSHVQKRFVQCKNINMNTPFIQKMTDFTVILEIIAYQTKFLTN